VKTSIHLAAGLLVGALSFLASSVALAEDPPLSDLAGREPVIRDLAPRVSRSFDPDAAPSTLSFSFATRQSAGRKDYAGSLRLTVPTDFFLAPGKAKETKAKAIVDEEVEDVGGAASAPPGPRRASLRSERALPPLRPRDARAAVSAAQDAAGVDEALERMDGLATRARWSALLPRLRLRATRLVDENTKVAPTSYDPSRRTSSGGASLWLEARTTWRLDRLVFASEEARIERLRMAHAKRAQQARREVLDLLYQWQRALLEVRDPALDSQSCLRAQLDAEHAAAGLDVLTDGWFSEWRARSGMPMPDCGWAEEPAPGEDELSERTPPSGRQRRVIDLAAVVPRQRGQGADRVRHHVAGEEASEVASK